MTLDHSRIGTVLFTFSTIENTPKDTWATLMSDLVIVDVDVDMEKKRVIYVAISGKFSELTDTAKVPHYVPSFNEEEGRFIWRR